MRQITLRYALTTTRRAHNHRGVLRTAFLLSTSLRLKRAVATLCLLTVAVVTTFHLCGLGTTRYASDVTSVYAAVDDSAPSQDRVAMERCHVCTVTAVADIVDAARPDRGQVPTPAITRLVSVQPKATAPPPKA